ncbi:MAG: enolase C-terminal domain-like protein [Alphaproteobacteria bacterium]
MSLSAPPKVTAFRIRPVKAPLAKPHRSASGLIEVASLVLLDVETDAGVTGASYVFVYAPAMLAPTAALLQELEALVTGAAVAPAAVTAMLHARFRLFGLQGLLGIAINAVDMALWDAHAKLAGLPLSRLLGGAPRPVRVYDSLGMMDPDDTARDVEASLAAGFRAFKIKAGRPDPRDDAAVVHAIRKVAGADCWVAADFNQAFLAPEATERMRVLDAEGLAWIEEPVKAEDHAGHAAVRAAIATPVQTGENWWGLPDMRHALDAQACDHAMPDVMKIGGVTGWMAAAALAEARQMPVSSHLFVEISAHLLASTPTAHMLEWFDLAAAVVASPPRVADGHAHADDQPGAGIRWNEAAIGRCLA